jgi:defect-in-organelle-trafficking protein DotC
MSKRTNEQPLLLFSSLLTLPRWLNNHILAAAVCVPMVILNTAYAKDAKDASQKGAQIDRLMDTVKSSDVPVVPISIVRESILRESATVFGAREGLRTQSCLIKMEIEVTRPYLDRTFRFSDLMMGKGVLPPVISEARDSVSLEETVMRVASRVYRIDEGARIIDVAPTWRDWLLIGLTPDDCTVPIKDIPSQPDLRPKDEQEQAFFRSVLEQSYSMGRQQAKDVLVSNMARMERAYFGMRRYFDLYARGMVSAPVIASSTDIALRDDPNTLVVGNTVIRITVPVDFIENSDGWKPLGE